MVDDLLEARMVSCNLTYGPEGDRNTSRLVTNFLPKHRWQGGLEVVGGFGRELLVHLSPCLAWSRV